MRFFSLCILICFLGFYSNAQQELPLAWGFEYDRIAAESQHFLYLDTWDDHHYIRTGKDNTQLLHKISAEHKVTKTIAFTKDYRGLNVYFERFIETAKGRYGYFKAPNPDNSELILLVAPFDGETFGALQEIYRHEFVKIPAVFQLTYPFIERDWMKNKLIRQFLVTSPDRTKIAYVSYHTPIGYRGIKARNGLSVVVLNDEFVIEKELLLEEAFEEEGTLENIAVDNEGILWGTLKKYMRKSDWKGVLSGKYLPRYNCSLVNFGEEVNILPLAEGEEVAISNVSFSWDYTQNIYHIAGCYSTGETKHRLDGLYVGNIINERALSFTTSPFSEAVLDREISYIRRYEKDYETQVLDKQLTDIDEVGDKMNLQEVHYNEDGSISWLFERYFDQATSESVRLRANSILCFIQTDSEGDLLNQKVFDKFFVGSYDEIPATLYWNENDQFHLIYPNMRSLQNRRALDENLKGGGALEYLVLDSSGETIHFETLLSNLSYLFDFNHPLAFFDGKVLFAKLTRDTYSLGSYKAH